MNNTELADTQRQMRTQIFSYQMYKEQGEGYAPWILNLNLEPYK